jgi:hypothetical protein
MLICVCLYILASLRISRYDLGRQTPYFLGGSVIVGYQSKIGVKHTCKHLKIATIFFVRNA